MPFYLYQHPETGEVVEVMQSMKDAHVFVDSEGTEWQRVWTKPNASVDSSNDGTEEGFLKYTENRKGTMGDLWDASKEASEKRKQKYGEDKILKKSQEDYSKKRNGMVRSDAKKTDFTL